MAVETQAAGADKLLFPVLPPDPSPRPHQAQVTPELIPHSQLPHRTHRLPGFSVISAGAAFPGVLRPPGFLRLAPSLSSPPGALYSPKDHLSRAPLWLWVLLGALRAGCGGQTWPCMALAVPLMGRAEDPGFTGDGCYQEAHILLLLGGSGDV